MFAPFLSGLNQFIAALFGGVSALEKAERKEIERANVPIRQRGSAARRNRLQTQITELRESPEAKAQLDLEEKISQVVAERVDLARRAADIEASRLTARRDVLAADRGSLEVQTQQNKLNAIELQLQGKLEDSKRRELEMEKKLTEEAKRQARRARANAIIEAQRQITRDVSSNVQATQSALIDTANTQMQILDIGRSQ